MRNRRRRRAIPRRVRPEKGTYSARRCGGIHAPAAPHRRAKPVYADAPRTPTHANEFGIARRTWREIWTTHTHTQDLAIESTHRWIVHDPNSDLPTKKRRWWNTRVTSLDGRAIDTAQMRPSLREGNSTPHFRAVPADG